MERTIAQSALVFASVLLTAALAGCGGGSQPAPGDGGQMPLPMPTTVALPSGHTLTAGTIPAGASQVVADANGMRTVVTCPAGGAACVVTLTDGGAESRGGALTVTTYTAIAGLPGGHSLAAGTTVPAGGSRQVHDDGRGRRTTVTCAAGGAACVVSARGDGTLESTGGRLTVGTTEYTVEYTTVALPSGHTLTAGTIPAGASQVVADANGMRTVVTCPAGGAACVVTLTDGGAESRGGALTVTTYTAIAGLPGGHSLAAGTTVPAGGSRQVHDDGRGRRTTVTCAAGGAACVVSARGDGTLESTGGRLTVGTTEYTTLADLPSGHGLTSGTMAAGRSRVVADANGMRTTVTCPAGGEACVITVANGRATSTGGEPTVTTISYTAIELPDGHTLAAGTMAAGTSRVVADADGMRTTVTCPGGEDAQACVVTLTDDGAESTGGGITVATVSYAAVEDLPGGHTLTEDTMIAAGARVVVKAYEKGRTYYVMCPGGEGAQACNLVVAEDGSVESRGGAATVTHETNEMIWQANNGPAGTSDGAHARGLVNRLTAASSRIGTPTDYTLAADGAATPPVQAVAGNVQGTVTSQPTAVVEWTNGASPTLELTLPSGAFTALSGQDADAGELTVDRPAPGLGTGWNGSLLSGSFLDGAKTMHAVVYTDATAPTGNPTPDKPRVSFATGLDLSEDSDVSGAVGGTAPTSDLEFGISSAAGQNVEVTIPLTSVTTLRTGSFLTAPISVTVKYDDAAGMSQTRPATLTCTSLVCRTAGGQLQGTWSLVAPKEDGAPGTPDDAHLILGAWLVLPSDSAASSDTSYNLGSFAYGVLGAASGERRTSTQLNALTDGATFTGRATGLYMTGNYSGSRSSRALANAEVGSFTADAELTVHQTSGNFAGVAGSVTNFREGARDLGWSMSLANTGAGSSGSDELFTGTTALETPTAQEATGAWGVQFYWEDRVGVEHAAGTFNASTDTDADRALHVVGAFGAENTSN